MKVYTRTGDDGSTGTLGSGRISKSHSLMEALGDIDELNAHLGVVRSLLIAKHLQAWITTIQSGLFDLGAELASDPEDTRFQVQSIQSSISNMEAQIDEWDAALPPLTQFVLPGGTSPSAALHVARTVCRRAERRVINLSLERPLRQELIAYLNRLSDWLFMLARYVNSLANEPETPWRNS